MSTMTDQEWMPPYDEVLDVFMRSAGWHSRRKEIEDGTRNSDFMFDTWSTDPQQLHGLTIQAIGGGQ